MQKMALSDVVPTKLYNHKEISNVISTYLLPDVGIFFLSPWDLNQGFN